ncbi:MAG: NADP-dependent isocitrate dehydrogenase [Proteobacteria bacterium]|nr:NADP-dependent isocitrate dehydrogenase [Pseudomonadota bacterium]
MSKSTIVYTITDEAPALATASFLPIVKKFTAAAGIVIESQDISLSTRVLANFPEFLTEEQRQTDALDYLGDLVKKLEANIIKLPNISASLPQLKAVIKELQVDGYAVPDYPDSAATEEEEEIKARYGKNLGSAVNPVIREGNSDRRVAEPVKQYARDNPHSMGEWFPESTTYVAHMYDGDFCSSEKSIIMDKNDNYRIVFTNKAGKSTLLKDKAPLLHLEIIDGSVLNIRKLKEFIEVQIKDTKEKDMLFSLHLKATMMKTSDPVVFGHVVKVYYKDVFAKYGDLFDELGVNVNNGIENVYLKIASLDDDLRQEIEAAIEACYETRADMAMVDSDKGITNLHVPNNVIIDASMPAAIRSSGKMWNKDGKLQDMKAIIPNRSYAKIYQEIIKYCKEHGAFNVRTMGSVPNVGLMAKKAEEYGSHDKTFIMQEQGVVTVINDDDEVLLKHAVEKDDIYRMCQTKDLPVRDWVKLAVNRARITGDKAIFWLDPYRAHDRNIMSKVDTYLKKYDIDDLDISFQSPVDAMRISCSRAREGKNTISVTGNVLRDYLTDLFPILELGTSAKMLSIVPLLNGGGLFETGAGGSAPKHVQQFVEEGHLRWDSLGEFLALAVSLEHIAETNNNEKAQIIADTLNAATTKLLRNKKSPSRKVNELDNRGSHFYLTLYWAQALAKQDTNKELKVAFTKLAKDLSDNEARITQELLAAQGSAVDIGGYFSTTQEKIIAAMRPSATFNGFID